MPSYLSHLLDDIRAAHRAGSPEEKPGSDTREAHLREVDRWISGDAEHPLSYYCGLQTEAFPSHNQLHKDEIQKICDAFSAMLRSWGFYVDLPDELPLSKKYELMVGLLDHTCTPVNTCAQRFSFYTFFSLAV